MQQQRWQKLVARAYRQVASASSGELALLMLWGLVGLNIALLERTLDLTLPR